jgi:hypothetical protein
VWLFFEEYDNKVLYFYVLKMPSSFIAIVMIEFEGGMWIKQFMNIIAWIYFDQIASTNEPSK